MSMQPAFDTGVDDIDLMAAEYVVGVLDANGRRLARERIEREPAFAADVARWESWFSPWLQSIAPVEPPASTWPRVRDALWPNERPEHDARTGPATRPSLWESLGFWRGLAAGGFAVALASVAALLLTVRQPSIAPPAVPTPVVVRPPPVAAPLVVSLRHDDGTTAYTATVDPARGTVVLVPVGLEGDEALSPELWLIPSGDKPHSLGMIRRGEAMVVDIPANLRDVADNGLLAISLEPAGSGPHDAPTGPVVAKGNVVRL
jgi:anti-sigma-K factor RskA